MELRRHDESYLDGLRARRTPDPTTAGDFCRRFTAVDVRDLMAVFDETRLKVWARQPSAFFDEALIDMDGTLVETGPKRCRRSTSRTTVCGVITRWWFRWRTRAIREK